MKPQGTILLAEDYADDITLLQRAFQRTEITDVAVVRTGDQAIDYLCGQGNYADRQAHPFPSLVLIDIKMPRRSGLEVLQWIRQESPFKRLPVVVLTSSQNIKDINEAYDLGANSYLAKPTDFQQLVKLVQAFAEYWFSISRLPTIP